MRKLVTLGIMLFLTGALCHAERFTGRLMDAACYNTNKVASQASGHKTYHSITKTCAPTESTTSFAVRITSGGNAGNTIRLDDSGNARVESALKSGELRVGKDGAMHVKVSGKLLGETLKDASVKPRATS